MKKLILIVDDEPRIGKVLGLKLKLSQYQVLTATDGKEALEIIKREKPDLVLLDLVMPEMDGYQVLQEVRTFSKVPIIIFTARPEGIEKAMRLGACDSIIKPFNPDQLVDKIRFVLGPQTA